MRVKPLAKWMLVGIMTVVTLFFAACVAFGPGLVAGTLATGSWPPRFSPEQWRARPFARAYMALDLAQSGVLRGKTTRQVHELLGDSDYLSDGIASWETISPGSDAYYLRVNRMAWFNSMPFASEQNLDVEFEHGRVVEWSLGGWDSEAMGSSGAVRYQ
jgi:hypothetical protein